MGVDPKSGNIVGTLDMLATSTEKALKEKKKIIYFIMNIDKGFYQKIRY